MRWIVEVGHVLRKDVRRAPWALLAYGLVVVLGTMRAVGVLPTFDPLNQMSAPLIVLFAAVLAAMAVQGDSPIRSDAFWAAHPFRPSAVLGAKVAFALVVIAIAASGQLVALRQHDVHGIELLALGIASAGAMGEWLLPAMLIAALTRDLRSFILAVILVWIGATIGFAVASRIIPVGRSLPGSASPESPFWLFLTAVALGLAALLWLYRARDPRRRTKLGSATAGIVVLLLFTITVRGAVPDAPAGGPPPEIGVRLVEGSLRIAGSQLRVDAMLPSPRGDTSTVIEEPTIVVHLRDGASLRLRPSSGPAPVGQPRRLTDLPEVGRLGGGRSSRTPVIDRISADLDLAARRALKAGVERVALEGQLLTLTRRELATLPLAAGAEWSSDGTLVRIESWSHEFGQPLLGLHTSVLRTGARRSWYGGWPWAGEVVQPVIVNDSESEAIILAKRRTSEGTDRLLLSGVPTTGQTAEFAYAYGDPRAEQPISEDWFAGAKLRLAVFEIRSRQPIRIETPAMP